MDLLHFGAQARISPILRAWYLANVLNIPNVQVVSCSSCYILLEPFCETTNDSGRKVGRLDEWPRQTLLKMEKRCVSACLLDGLSEFGYLRFLTLASY